VAYYLSVCRWKRQHGLPDRVFVRVDATQAATEQSNEQATESELKFSRKPTYIDFASLFSVQQFRAAVSKLSSVQLLAVTEMSPSPEDIPSRDSHHTVVNEIILELNQPGGIYQ
jgi:hypothetical protein